MQQLASSLSQITRKKALLDSHKPLPASLIRNLEGWFKIELTFTSNALEGNTLTRMETAAILEHGSVVGAKSMREHLEAANHNAALTYICDNIIHANSKISVKEILAVHSIILRGIDDQYAGRYRDLGVRISGSEVILPNAAKLPLLMQELDDWLQLSDTHTQHTAIMAAEAHYRLVTIHPFIDGNGRTARLAMNSLLMQSGYPPAIIRIEDRLEYLSKLEKAQLSEAGDKINTANPDHIAYMTFILTAIERSLDIYLDAINDSTKPQTTSDTISTPLLKIGALAKATNLPVATIRFWTKEGLLSTAGTTSSGYQLYSQRCVQRCREILELQQKARMTIKEIKERLT